LFGGFTVDRLIKKTNSNRLGVIYVLVLSIGAFGTLIAYTSIYKYSAIAYIFALFFGLLDSSTSTHAGMLLGFEFGDKSVIAFGL
jgi:hypothetical protein